MTFLLFAWLLNIVEPASEPVKPMPVSYSLYLPVVSW